MDDANNMTDATEPAQAAQPLATDEQYVPTEDAAPDLPEAKESPASPAEMAATVEAVLFASDSPLTAARIAQVARIPQKMIKAAIQSLSERYEQAGSAFRIEEIAGGFQMLTLPCHHDVLSRLLKARGDSRLSQASLETLAIVAYRQPILRADIEAIRGVACGEVLRGLMEKNLIKIVGRAEIVGRPMLYGTTKRFLEVFGLADLEDLPRVEELRSGSQQAKAAPAIVPAEQPAEAPAAEAPGTSSAAPVETGQPAPGENPSAG